MDNKVLLAGLIRPDHKAGCFWGGVGWAAIIIGSLGNLTQLGRNFLWRALVCFNEVKLPSWGGAQRNKRSWRDFPRFQNEVFHDASDQPDWSCPASPTEVASSQDMVAENEEPTFLPPEESPTVITEKEGPESDSKVRKTILPPRQEAVVYIVDFRGHISYGDASQEILWLPLVGNSRLSFPSQTSQVKLRMASTASAVLQGGQEKSTKWGPGPDVRGEMELFEAGNFWGWMPQKPPGWRYYHLWQTGDPKLTPILHQWYRHWFFWWDWLLDVKFTYEKLKWTPFKSSNVLRPEKSFSNHDVWDGREPLSGV